MGYSDLFYFSFFFFLYGESSQSSCLGNMSVFCGSDLLIGCYCKHWFTVYKNPLQVTVQRLGMSLGSFCLSKFYPSNMIGKVSSQLVFFTMASKIGEFISAPSESLLNNLTKDQLVELAGHYEINLVSQDKRLKDNIKFLIKS